ncbi:MAG: fasciclin domain-containing protein [Methylococcaceae bacterium]|nr:fasciclin domain-containing protein [Prolixibacteraceae bacterium]
MKKSNLIFAFALVLFSAVFMSCQDETQTDGGMKKKTIVDVAKTNPDLSILVDALGRTGLDAVLSGTGSNFTVFAPTNAAFTSLLADLGASSLNDIPNETLKKVLMYHVVNGNLTASKISTGYYSSLAEGPKKDAKLSLYVDMSSTKINNRAAIKQTDVKADNGVIHIIDKVLLPMSITDHAIANTSFSSLVAALSKANLVSALNDSSKTFTVFAPTNDAFSKLFTDLGATLDDLSAETLTPILLYHVVSGVVPASEVKSGYVPTLSTAFGKNVSLQVNVSGGVKLNNSVNVTATDVVATNGIIHVIDKVLLPPTVVDIAQQNPLFSTLVLAVIKADLAGTLSKEGPFTVFAPTNDAFSALFKTLNVSGIDALSKEALTPILLAHVVSGNVQSGDLSSGSVPTLNDSKSLDVAVSGSSVTIDGSINVVLADVQAKNGVVHVIDKVIVP